MLLDIHPQVANLHPGSDEGDSQPTSFTFPQIPIWSLLLVWKEFWPLRPRVYVQLCHGPTVPGAISSYEHTAAAGHIALETEVMAESLRTDFDPVWPVASKTNCPFPLLRMADTSPGENLWACNVRAARERASGHRA